MLTDSAFVVVKYEVANFAAHRISRFRQQGKNPSDWDLSASGSDKVEIAEAFRELEEILGNEIFTLL